MMFTEVNSSRMLADPKLQPVAMYGLLNLIHGQGETATRLQWLEQVFQYPDRLKEIVEHGFVGRVIEMCESIEANKQRGALLVRFVSAMRDQRSPVKEK